MIINWMEKPIENMYVHGEFPELNIGLHVHWIEMSQEARKSKGFLQENAATCAPAGLAPKCFAGLLFLGINQASVRGRAYLNEAVMLPRSGSMALLMLRGGIISGHC